MGVVKKVLADVITPNRGTFLSFGILGTLWAASGGFAAAIEALNIAYDVEETRPFWKTRPLAIGLTFAMGGLLLAALTIPAQAMALNALLRTDRWRTLPTVPEEQEQAIHGFTDLLIASLQRHFQLPIQPITFPILIGPATVASAPYTLLFATRRQDSLNCMNDAVCIYRQRVEQESYHGVLGEEWFVSQQRARQEQALQQLHQRICQQGQAQRTRRWPDLRQHLLLAQFGQFTLQDYDASIQQLLRNGEVRCVWRQPPISPEEERIPGNDDTLVWRQ